MSRLIIPYSSTIFCNPKNKSIRSLQSQDEYDNLTDKLMIHDIDDQTFFSFQCVEKNKDNETKKVDNYLISELELNPDKKSVNDVIHSIPSNIMDIYKDSMHDKVVRENFLALIFSMIYYSNQFNKENKENNTSIRSMFLVPRPIQILFINHLLSKQEKNN